MNMVSAETPVAAGVRLKSRPVILSGGAGTRLWPLSRSFYPKQLLALQTSATMLQATAQRAHDAARFAAPLVVCGEDHRFLIAEQLAACGATPDVILLEPEGRNTAPAIALAALWLVAGHPDEPMLIMPSDHVIADQPAFAAAVGLAEAAARKGRIVTFGITPTAPETGYGYIRMGAPLTGSDGVRAVEAFVEKPDLDTARTYLAAGTYVWNSGIFMMTPRTCLDELARHAPAVKAAAEAAMHDARADGLFLRPGAGAFRGAPNISIDYAVAEKSDRVCVVPVDMGWSDVGSWEALWQIGQRDGDGNVASGDVLAVDSHNNLMRVEGGPTVAAVGVNDMVIVSTRDAVLVAPRERAQDVKIIVDKLKADGRQEHIFHAVVHRPWGTYQSVDAGERFQTKRIVVKPGAQLSLQMHHHRSEHWIVVSGSARVTVGDQIILLQENQSTYIPAGTLHRLENPGKIPLHLIEVQCGPYLGEDDIVRFEDSYGRA